MIPFSFSPDIPWSVKLAADARLTTTDYADDAIYALRADGTPLGLASSYGGRCVSMTCDLHWQHAGHETPVSMTHDYATPPVLQDCGPGFALIEAHPFPGMQARVAFIAHTSHVVVCPIDLRNVTDQPVSLTLTSIMHLHLHEPVSLPEPVTALQFEDQTYGAFVYTVPLQMAMLWDQAGPFDLESSPDARRWTIRYHRTVTLAPGEQRTLLSGLLTPDQADSEVHPLHSMAHTVLTTDWDRELARHRLASAGIPVVETGNADWDVAIACAYRMAARCYLSGSGDTTPRPEVPGPGGRAPDIHRSGVGYPPLPYSSFVFTRIPERGHAPGGQAEEHSWQWNGQVATEAYVSVSQVASFAPELAKAVLRNYLHIQQEDGYIDWKPGLGGQRAGWDCIPLLATLARIIYDYTGDLDFLHDVFGGLLRHLDRWFDPANDRNDDDYPEWAHTVQSGFDDNPSFVPWRRWSQGADVSRAVSPDLGAYLYREHRELITIGRLLPDQRRLALNVDLVRLTHRADRLRDQIEARWDEQRATYLYGDYVSHLTHGGQVLWETRGPGEWHHAHKAEGGNGKVISIAPPIPPPALARRVVIRIEGPDAPQVAIMLQGQDANEQPLTEVIERRHFNWWGPEQDAVTSVTSEGRFSSLTSMTITGIDSRQHVRVSFVDYTRQDQTQLLPLWAGVPDAVRAEALVLRTITDPARFWRSYGIPNCSAADPAYASDNQNGSGGVWLHWNTMIGEGLCDYGYFSEAWELFSRIITAQIHSLTTDHCFREAYDSDTGAGLGDADYVWGNVPLHLLTRLHGVQIISDNRVRLLPSDTLGRHIVVHQHGVRVERTGRRAMITWPDGQHYEQILGDETVLVQPG